MKPKEQNAMSSTSRLKKRKCIRAVLRCILSGEDGVETVELVIALPIFFGLLFGFVDIARIVSSYSSVRAAVDIGGRQAVGEQVADWACIDTLMGGASSPSSTNWAGLTSVPEFVSDTPSADKDSQKYADKASALGLTKIYRIEARAIAYANRILTESLGTIDYPCENKAGCAMCFTLRGDADLYNKYFSFDTGGGNLQWTSTMLGVQCTYNVPITTTLVAMGWLPDYIPVTARIYVPINNYAGAQYDPSS